MRFITANGRVTSPLFLITVAYFTLPMINILFAFAAVGCMIIPFVLLNRTGGKTWCRLFCPRSDFLLHFKRINIGFKTPKWLKGRAMRRNMLVYFSVNILFITMSTFMVSLGRIDPIDKIRLLIVFQLPVTLPQLLMIENLPASMLHLSYRFYSLMLTSTLLGTMLAILFKPKTWCTICPINTLSGRILTAKKEILSEQIL